MRLWASVLAFVAVVVACSALYASWRHRETAAVEQPVAASNPKPETPVSQQTPPTAPPTAAPVPEPAQGGGTAAVQTSGTEAAAPPDAKTAADKKSVQEAVAKPPESAPGSPGASPAVNPASADDKVVVSVSAKEPAWVALSSDGKTVYSGTLDAAQTKTVGGKEQARMRVGNAGGVEVTFNGKPVGPIGPRGQVRIVVFTPAGYQIVNPAAAGSDGSVDTPKARPPTL
jgi:cytoskeleton protein RodZ